MTIIAKKSKKTNFFLPYQMRWLDDNSKVKIWEKSRRIGATYVQSYEDVRDCVKRTVPAVWFSSADESAAREYIDYCKQWATLFNIAAKDLGEQILDKEKDIKAYVEDVVENHDDLQAYAKENLSMDGSPLKKEKRNNALCLFSLTINP